MADGQPHTSALLNGYNNISFCISWSEIQIHKKRMGGREAQLCKGEEIRICR